ncbi:hypothetical protein Tco_1413546 [Tanacetum coccineum]
MEKYLALTRGNQALGVVKLEIGGNVNFEINSQFMRELREDTFSGNKNDDGHEHVERVLDIVSLFNIPGVSHMYCPPSRTAKQLEEIRNFKQKGDETLYQAWERRSRLDKDCPLNEEVKSIKEAKYGEFGRSSPFSNGAKYSVGPPGYYTRIEN